MSVWAKYLKVDFLGNKLIAENSTKIECIKPVFADDALTGKANVTGLAKRISRNGFVEMIIEAFNQNSELVLTNI